MTQADSKYVVFKRDEFMQMMGKLGLPPWNTGTEVAGESWDCAPFAQDIIDNVQEIELDDAVVIRKRDAFSAPVLYAYASMVQTAVELLQGDLEADESLNDRQMARLLQLCVVRDYFQDAADEAARVPHRFPTP